jgi:chaperonin GroES
VRFKPLDDRILVKKHDPETVSEGGIILPDAAQQPADWGDVVEVGPGARINGTDARATLAVQIGDRVRFGRHSGFDVKIDGEDYYIITEGNILGVLGPVSPVLEIAR